MVDESIESPAKKIKIDSTPCCKEDEEDVVKIRFKSQNVIRFQRSILIKHSIVFEKMLSQEFIEAKEPFIFILDVNEEAFTVMLHFLAGCSVWLDSYETNCDKHQCRLSSKISNIKTLTSLKSKGYSEEDTEYCNDRRKSCSGICSNPGPETRISGDDEEEETGVVGSSLKYSKQFSEDCQSKVFIREDDHSIHNDQSKVVEKKKWKFAFDLLSCSERFFVDELKTYCEQYLLGEITAENVVDLYMLSTWHRSNLLAENTLVYILTMVKCPKLRTEYFIEILQSHEKGNFVNQVQSLLSQYFNQEVS